MALTCPCVIIGRISLNMTWTVNPSKDEKKIERMAAQAGADGILITSFDVNICAFNQYITTRGYATVSGSNLSYFAAVSRPHPIYLEQILIYGCLIKRTG